MNVVVPEEPTEAMVAAGTLAAVLNQDRLAEDGIPEIYRAMIEAAPKVVAARGVEPR